ncbi:MAG: GFA family protein [Henriciella sp.]|uniref:GFA family protein n=1 Tax=Henriciella sp. TaxID=1968823 RepID=UPI003C761B76
MAGDEMTGGCACGKVRYRLTTEPMITHCCHCRRCQQETGSAFVINGVIEMSAINHLGEAPETIGTPTDSGQPQLIDRCPNCHVAVWSQYTMGRGRGVFVRLGTLDAPDAIAPDVHIYTKSRLPWVTLTDDKPQFEEFYPSRDVVWPEGSLARWSAMMKA